MVTPGWLVAVPTATVTGTALPAVTPLGIVALI
jgi:hypothetical protein